MALHLVIGGVRSGKSELAERLAGAAGAPVCYVATGAAGDAEMAERIARHRRRRPEGWRTVETDDPPTVLGEGPAPLWFSDAPASAPADPDETVLVDGIGAWFARLMVDEGLWTDADVAPLGQDGEAAWDRVLDQVRAFADAAATRPGLTIVVAEEGGLGLVPQGAGARRYLDLMGEGTQLLAKAAATVRLVVAGQAIDLTPATKPAQPDRPVTPVAAREGGQEAITLPANGPPVPDGQAAAERTGLPAPVVEGGAAGPPVPPPAAESGEVAPQAGRSGTARVEGAPGQTVQPVAAGDPGAGPQPGPPAAADARAIPAKLRLHGDTVASPGQLDFAVNVIPGGPPAWLRGELLAAADRVGEYPDERPAAAALAARHGRDAAEVLPTNGSAEAFWLLARVLRPARPVVVHPTFTEPEVALRVAGHSVQRVFRHPRHFGLDPGAVPENADLVVVGNPNNPTGNLDPAGLVAGLARAGRVLVVDEAFMEFTETEAESLAGRGDLPGLVVVRSLTKLWALPGVRAGYLLCDPGLAAELRAARQPWSVNGIACAALIACAGDRTTPARVAERVTGARDELVAGLRRLPGVRVWPSAANFLLLAVPAGEAVRSRLAERGIAVRPADSFPGLGPDHLRVAVRPAAQVTRLVTALTESLAAVSA
jgi:L-threonine-O-3-phosphate decarboxylase